MNKLKVSDRVQINTEGSYLGRTSLTELANRFGSDKGTHFGDWGVAHEYAEVYERFLAARRLEPIRLLELGVWKGASLRMWEAYFPNAEIIGIDNLPDVVQQKLERAEVLIGDAADAAFLTSAVDRFAEGKIDIVVDDCGHVLDQQIRSFEKLFPLLDAGGLYFVEDVSGSRFKDGNPGALPFLAFLDYSWNLAQQTTFFEDTSVSTFHNIREIGRLSPAERDRLGISVWNRELEGVYYFGNLCVFEKRRKQRELGDLRHTDRLRPGSGIGFQLEQSGSSSQRPGLDDSEVEKLEFKFHDIVESLADLERHSAGSPEAESQTSGLLLTHQANEFAGLLGHLIDAFKSQTLAITRLETFAGARESERVRVSHEVAVLQNANASLLDQIARLQAQLEEGRSKMKSVWDSMFRERAERVAESSQLRSEIAILSEQMQKLQDALVASKRQNNILRAENADRKLASSFATAGLAKKNEDALRTERELLKARERIVSLVCSKYGASVADLVSGELFELEGETVDENLSGIE
jgi:hypothetical protein